MPFMLSSNGENPRLLPKAKAPMVFPNPTRGQLEVQFNSADEWFKITSISGKQIQTGRVTNQRMVIDLIGFASGTYYLTTNNADGAVKFIVID